MQEVNWAQHYPYNCFFYPGRDCPGWHFTHQPCFDECQRVHVPLPIPPADELLIKKKSAVIEVSNELLEGAQDMNDLIGKAMRGEIQFKPIPLQKPHKCLFCWLLSKLPGHERCRHGRLECEDCADY
jgi:hypothetical protein